ncbi:hypothetical protein TBLA_0A03330 [Henningerozyma blattae CBS 6284]|uniref:EngB-type G domain-containing protein n=1 Tax=Henningerozyma blattae (strain ATCC 34711 / CBS 6284 / DSM 70876 / NBRC 10599 / NRRL Y-10934 / UCD 77-7) TaxID=1071380 RepID=I2GVI1_HENB6|nr:hypothetical protein TBLA_0A03330 [Tetrapisispora blattae CBS 6284]CCH58133.1 hypothetical protein TBLA_0A03330 [Tetrapisispora blattae CBS 6284]
MKTLTSITKNIVLTTKKRVGPAIPSVKTKKKDVVKNKTIQSTNKKSISIYKWNDLNKSINKVYRYPTDGEINEANYFFNSSKVDFAWANSDPDKLFSLIDRIKHPKPEVLFLGRSNSGKSTLLNNIVTNLHSNSLDRVAKVSKKTGFTKTLNCFTIGNKLNIIDTPGYGQNSSVDQGDLVMKYLKQQKALCRVFLLISAEKSINKWDSSMIDFLSTNRIAYDLVFTKIDKIKHLDSFKKELKDQRLDELPIFPRLILTNSETNKKCLKRYGVDFLRSVILESCNLSKKKL